jgi:large subunit ribosomal protein L31
MAKSIELTYFPNATAKCSNCSSTYKMGMTVENITIEICGNCHPFYTGQETLIDTAGRIEKFQARSAKAGAVANAGKKQKVKARKFRQTLADLNDLGSEAQESSNHSEVKTAKAKKEAPKQDSSQEPATQEPELVKETNSSEPTINTDDSETAAE